MKHNFSGRLGGEFVGVMEHLRRLSCFPERNVSDKHYFCVPFFKAIFDTSGFHGCFSINGTDLCRR